MSDYLLEQSHSDTSSESGLQVWSEARKAVRVRLIKRAGLILGLVVMEIGMMMGSLTLLILYISGHSSFLFIVVAVLLFCVFIFGTRISVRLYYRYVARTNRISSKAFKSHIVRNNIISSCQCRLYEFNPEIAPDCYRLGNFVVVYPLERSVCSDYISGRYNDIDFRMMNVEFYANLQSFPQFTSFSHSVRHRIFRGNLFAFKLPGRLNKSYIHIYSRLVSINPETPGYETPLFGEGSSSDIYIGEYSVNYDISEEYEKLVRNESDWMASHHITSEFYTFENIPERDITFTFKDICSDDFKRVLKEQFEERKKHFHLHIEKNILLIAIEENKDLFEPRIDNISLDLDNINRLVQTEFTCSIEPVAEVVSVIRKIILGKHQKP